MIQSGRSSWLVPGSLIGPEGRSRLQLAAIAGSNVPPWRGCSEDLRGGRLTAWARVDGKTFPIAPEHWRALEPTFTRVRFLAGFAEIFGRLIVTVRDGMGQDIRNLTILSEAMQQIFPADAAVIAAPVRRRTQPGRDRARMGLKGRFGQKIPSPTEMSNGVLC